MAKFHSIPSKRLAESISSIDTSFSIRSTVDWSGNTLDPVDFDSVEYGVFRNESNTRLEFFSYDASDINNGNITILKRGLDYQGDLTNEDTDRQFNWIKGVTIVELGSDPSQIFQYLSDLITDGLNAGASDATDTVKGLSEIATDAEIEAGTTTGGSGARLSIPADSSYLSRNLTRQVSSESSSATPTIDTDTTDVHRITALTTDITSMTTNLSGNPDIWDTLVVEIIGTATRSIAWGVSFASGGLYNLPTATNGTTPLKVIFNWNGNDWVIIGIA